MLIPAIHFPGTCTEAHALYQKAFGMVVSNVTYNKDALDDYGAGEGNKVLHSECNIYGTRINMSDGGETSAGMISFNIFLKSEDDVRKAFTVLKDDGGVVNSELQSQFWTSLHGAITDRLGIAWQIMTE